LYLLARRCPYINVGLLEAKRRVGRNVFSRQMDGHRPHRPGHETLPSNDDHRLALMGLIPQGTAWATSYPAHLQVAIIPDVTHHVARLVQGARHQTPWTVAAEPHEQIS
jgi:hypothetical protein